MIDRHGSAERPRIASRWSRVLGAAGRSGRALIADRRGTFAMTAALCAVPLIGMTGLAVDYAIALSNKTKLDAAADAAAIAAVTKAKAAINKGYSVSQAEAQGQQQGLLAFAANSGGTSYTATAPQPIVSWQTQQGQTLSVKVSYTTTSYSQFGKIFDVGTYSVGGSSSSTTVLTPYYQIIFVVDVSNSMGIGGTPSDIAGLQARYNCAFACHNPQGTDSEAIAHNAGYKLKIDYVNSAVQSFISDFSKDTQSVPGYFSVGIDTFGSDFATLQVPSFPPATALPAAKTIDLEAAHAPNNGYTQTTSSLVKALSGIHNIGDGSSPTSQATYVIFVSDGVEDVPSSATIWGRDTDLNYGSACAAIKQAGATLVTIEANYSAIPGDAQYERLVAPLQSPASPNMQSAMQACATDPTWAFQANDGPAIQAAANSILSRVLQGLTRITR